VTTVLIVDDDPHIRDLIHIYLRNEQYQVLEAEDGENAWRILEQKPVDLVVLDIMLPQVDGWELCQSIKQSFDIPVLMVTAQGEASQRIKGFKLGTDDYMVKPFDPEELVLRVQALLRRYHIISSQTIRIGSLWMDRNMYEASVNGERLILPLKEFELLFKLASYPGQVFTRTQLIEQIWGIYYEGDERTVDVHIKRIRERLAEKTGHIQIGTVRGLGYKLEVPDEE